MKSTYFKLFYLIAVLFVVVSFVFAVTTDIFGQIKSNQSIFYYAYWAVVMLFLLKLIEIFIKSEIFSYYYNKYYLTKEKP